MPDFNESPPIINGKICGAKKIALSILSCDRVETTNNLAIREIT